MTACANFAWGAGHHTITLWTVASLTAAFLLYDRAESQFVATEPGHVVGQDLVNEIQKHRLTEQG